MSEPCMVLIGAEGLLPALRERAGASGEVLSFTDTDALAAFEAIAARRPRTVALERLFAATSRGAALINRIKADPALSSAEILIVSHDSEYSRISPRRPSPAPQPGAPTAAPVAAATAMAPPSAPAAAPATLDYKGTRRAPRFRMAEGTETLVDGTSVKLIDLSVVGAQVVSAGSLRPHQRIWISLSDDTGVVRCDGTIVWASFESPNSTPRYRAGIDFRAADAAAVDAFLRRHQT